MKKSYIAESIMREYERKKRYEAKIQRQELAKFIKENCLKCKNKSTDLCEIRRNIDGNLQCVNKKI